MNERRPVIQLEYAPPAVGKHLVWRRIGRFSATAGSVVALFAWGYIILVSVRSVVVTGPALMTLGILAFIGGRISGMPWIWSLGAAHCAVCLLFFTLVKLLHWGPDAAQMPFTWMGLIYCGLIIIPTVIVSLRSSLDSTIN